MTVIEGLCPHCDEYKVYSYIDPVEFECQGCGTSWGTSDAYEAAFDAASAPKTDYINSGALNDDVTRLVEAVEIRLLKDLELWLPTLDRYGNGEIPVAVLVAALRDVSAGRRMQAGL